jgi:hypothetical protein
MPLYPPFPSASSSVAGIAILDGTAGDIQPVGTGAAGTQGQSADAKHVHPVGYSESPASPTDMGVLAWSIDVGCCSGSTVPTTGQVNLIRVNIRQAISVTNVILAVNVAGTGLTSSQNFAGLYAGQTVGAYTAGVQIGTSADQSSAWGTTGIKVAALAGGPFAIPANTFVWVVFCSNTGTSTPSFFRGGSTQSAGLNLGGAVATARFATNGTATTALPASLTVGSNVLAGVSYWAALS